MTVIDIAGLVKGAAEGQGLGNAFLSHIKAVDGIFHLCRAFDDAEIVHVEGEIDPVRDLQIIHEELRLKDEDFLNKLVNASRRDVERLGKGGSAQDKEKKEQFEVMVKAQKLVCDEKKDIRAGEWNGKEIELINTWFLLTAKPVVYLVFIYLNGFYELICFFQFELGQFERKGLLSQKEQVASQI